jgi:hypothetical protein
MELLHAVAFDKVMEHYLRNHPENRVHEANSNRDGAQNLRRAQQMLGSWSKVRLDRSEVLAVTLPWHLSEGGSRELVPRSGLTVGQAAERIRSGGAEIIRENPVCSAKLDWLRSAPLTAVFVSTRPVPHSDYADLLVRDGLVHLDGLHRMIAWELCGRLLGGARLEAFVAGELSISPDRHRASRSASP